MFSAQQLEAVCRTLGFDMIGVTPAAKLKTGKFLVDWIGRDMHATMRWIPRNVAKRVDPSRVLSGARSIISLGMSYNIRDIPSRLLSDQSRGIIARYALADDYHDLMLPYLDRISQYVQDQIPGARTRYYVDTGPMLERDIAREAGLGHIGRNANIINPTFGSFVFLAEILIDRELSFAPKQASGTCGMCTRCKDACPTGAIVSDRVIDARRCISYLTIENRGSIPEDLRPLMGNRIYGCDICQEVCPWNKIAKKTRSKIFQIRPDLVAPKLSELAYLTEEDFRAKFRHSPIKRAKYHGLLRNVAVALGNWRSSDALPPLEHLAGHSHALVREHAEWALKQI